MHNLTEWLFVWLDHVLSWHSFQYNGRILCDQISAWWHIGMYLAPIELATVLLTSETAIRDHKSVPILNHRKLIGSDSDNRVPDRNLDAFPYQLYKNMFAGRIYNIWWWWHLNFHHIISKTYLHVLCMKENTHYSWCSAMGISVLQL